MTEHPLRPEERHRDLEAIHSIISFGVRTLIIAIVPLMVTGICALIAGYFQQQSIVKQQTEMANGIKELSSRLEDTNKKVSVMWYVGKWDNHQASK